MQISEKNLLLENYVNRELLDPKTYNAVVLFLSVARERDNRNPHFFVNFPELINIYQNDEFMDKVGRVLDDSYLKFKAEKKSGKLNAEDVDNVEKEIATYNFIISRLNLASTDKRRFSDLIGISHDLYRPREESLHIRQAPSIITYLKCDKETRFLCQDFVFKSERFQKGRLSDDELASFALNLEKGKLSFIVVYLQKAFSLIKKRHKEKKNDKSTYELACHQREMINQFLDAVCERAKKKNPRLKTSSFQVLNK